MAAAQEKVSQVLLLFSDGASKPPTPTAPWGPTWDESKAGVDSMSPWTDRMKRYYKRVIMNRKKKGEGSARVRLSILTVPAHM